MSSTTAVAAVTETLRTLLDTGIPVLDAEVLPLEVTTRPLDVARTNVTGPSLNLFLYRTAVNTGWANTELPPGRPEAGGRPPLALNLQYLVTAYGPDAADTKLMGHRVLGGAMSVLHDHPVLDAAELTAAMPGSDVAAQFERLRITPLPLGVDDISRLWGAFQSQYRTSVAYEVTVVLIDSHTPTRSALPVLTRGRDDRGVAAVAGGAPLLRALRPPRSQAAALLGDEVEVDGLYLDADLEFRLTSTALSPPPPQVAHGVHVTPERFVLRLPALTGGSPGHGTWAPGFHTVTATSVRTGVPPVVSNATAVALAPAITVSPNGKDNGTVPVGSTVTVTCAPRVRDGQAVQLLVGDRLVEPATITDRAPADPTVPATTPSRITFVVPLLSSGTHTVRLRVDGVDSIPVAPGTTGVPEFDPKQQVRVP